MSSPRPLSGQVAWVTGSSRGIGRVLAERLCADGAQVVVHGTRIDSPRAFGEGDTMEQVAADIAAAANGETMAVWGDITDEAEVARIAGEIRSRWGRIDILVNCAGGNIGAGGTSTGKGGRPPVDDCLGMPLADLRAVMGRNLLRCLLCCREVAPEMIERRAGRIINIGSTAGTYGRAEGAIYAVAKAAVHHYTRCLADQLRGHNIPVNCVAPAGTVTQRFLTVHRIDDQKLVEEGTLERYNHPQKNNTKKTFLASPASQYVSGQILCADGGQFAFGH